MKKIVLAIALLVSVSTLTFAKNSDNFFTNLVKSDLTVKTLDGLKFKITATELMPNATVEIKDQRGHTLYKEKLTSENYAKVFNLSDLPDGNYKVYLSSGEVTFAKPIEIETQVKRIAKTK
ncbi:hypothetical protein LAG90_16935 [Marinilongibacter aquaticus]|uniref:DUF3244 domain-containing protein n=1 Tax=Marinilongibacter aquaticus TaxID=2975157 RepID=UPI0021BDE074|nr:hypothetical protein [Marinilongibacter aquaticus]UBM58491.1 hypothetical protein LAG90_16935 [Marinilongibacter aquaticus]